MEPGNYAIVSYLPKELGALVDSLRRELNPKFAGLSAHLTLLPLRALAIGEEEAEEQAQQCCAEFEPFEVAVTGVATFLPVSNVVYLAVGAGEPDLRRLHEALNNGGLGHSEPFPYIPHITIIQEQDPARTRELQRVVAERLERYTGLRSFRVETVMFVRQTDDGRWLNLAPIELGSAHLVRG